MWYRYNMESYKTTKTSTQDHINCQACGDLRSLPYLDPVTLHFVSKPCPECMPRSDAAVVSHVANEPTRPYRASRVVGTPTAPARTVVVGRIAVAAGRNAK